MKPNDLISPSWKQLLINGFYLPAVRQMVNDNAVEFDEKIADGRTENEALTDIIIESLAIAISEDPQFKNELKENLPRLFRGLNKAILYRYHHPETFPAYEEHACRVLLDEINSFDRSLTTTVTSAYAQANLTTFSKNHPLLDPDTRLQGEIFNPSFEAKHSSEFTTKFR